MAGIAGGRWPERWVEQLLWRTDVLEGRPSAYEFAPAIGGRKKPLLPESPAL